MSDAKALYDYEQDLERLSDASVERHQPITAEQVKDKNLVHLLAEQVKAWPTHDLRLEAKYWSEHLVDATDDDFMTDIARGMTQRVRRKNLAQGMLWMDVLFQNNMAECERFNLTALDHNQQWQDLGSPEEVFDPITGDVKQVEDRYIAPAVADSEHLLSPYQLTDDSCGPLAKARPGTKRSVGVTIQYYIEIIGEVFHLEYVARDTQKRVLYYNSLYHKNLTYLVRRSVQELWGHPGIYDDEGAYFDGIAMLYRGQKIAIARKKSTKPSILDFKEESVKDTTIERVMSQTERASMSILVPIFAYVIPVIGTLYVLMTPIACLAASQNKAHDWVSFWGMPISTHSPGSSFLVLEAIIMGIIIGSVKLAGYLQRKECAMSQREKFI